VLDETFSCLTSLGPPAYKVLLDQSSELHYIVERLLYKRVKIGLLTGMRLIIHCVVKVLISVRNVGSLWQGRRQTTEMGY